MDAFDDAFGAAPAAAPAGEVDAFAAAEVDPAAEFLAQEQVGGSPAETPDCRTLLTQTRAIFADNFL